ncbi:two-component system response regulator RssB [Erwinia sp. OLTSP20]|uniref:two-component system response regulator RssB n=1 Tax=unclassified Erwinia TaxID=2622719 RepID=UPI000C1A5C42|nr:MULTISPECIES: two-component system response regulator RssB [unclassified Erwinia]PIJ51646.1 two-component system response regulator RssB [Erwinia sp. OAMSP11]PIJ69723.1 two-component system response regulator RssB [Erwinia sp. OLSSP12]PIJ79446.1 two-component system response regulator RssB [Erwinia sp. OLCASP19]PIJ86616.1 two-component system response regulator RssB [Erwinia sp. OLMTSP26]PIJ88057.1 two-component system response regulator RssB [Erwinia sp. OLMDSP33]
MEQPLSGKHILVVEDEVVFRTLLESFLASLGAQVTIAGDGVEALERLRTLSPDLLICDLAMPRMNGIKLVEHLRMGNSTLPVLIISATENMSDIAHVLRLGVQDVLLKPVRDLSRLREAVLECLYPSMFTSKVQEDEQLFQDWDALVRDPPAAAKLLKELQPPVQQTLAGCRVNYRQLTMAEQPGLVLDIAALSEKDLAFYCLDVTRAGDNGVLAALLLRALFNGLLQEQLSGQAQRLPELSGLLKQVNLLLRQANLSGQFPLLVGYYHQALKNLILVSAGLNATLNINSHQIQLSNGVPLGTLESTHLNQISQRCDAWQCQVWGTGGKLWLMLSTD